MKSKLACPPGERLEDEKWAEIARDYLDEEHDHIHLLVSRMGLEEASEVKELSAYEG